MKESLNLAVVLWFPVDEEILAASEFPFCQLSDQKGDAVVRRNVVEKISGKRPDSTGYEDMSRCISDVKPERITMILPTWAGLLRKLTSSSTASAPY